MFDGALIDAVLNVTFFKEKKLLPYCQKLGLKVSWNQLYIYTYMTFIRLVKMENNV